MVKILFGIFLICLVTYQTHANDAEAQFKQLQEDMINSLNVGSATLDHAKNYIDAVVKQENLELDYTANELRKVYTSEKERAEASNKDITQCAAPILEKIDYLAIALEKCYNTDIIIDGQRNLVNIVGLERSLSRHKAFCEQSNTASSPELNDCFNSALRSFRIQLNVANANIDLAARKAALNSMVCIQEQGTNAVIQSELVKNEFLECVAKI